MKVIRLVSNEEQVPNELELILWLLDNGLDFYHFRKPNWTLEEKERLIKEIPLEYRNRIVAHHKSEVNGVLIHHKSDEIVDNGVKKHSCSNHSKEEVEKNLNVYENCFWSPVFDSISKENYKGNSEIRLQVFNSSQQKRIIALGGVEPSRFAELKEKGFSQLAIKGWFWNQSDYKKAWLEIKHTWQELEKKY